ncbi:MAG: hypothetical protein QXM73_02800 [Candidatus Nezhaarchaeales archaeon]
MAREPLRLSLREGSRDERLLYLICFPKPDEEEFQRRLRQLLSLGIVEIVLDGTQKIDNLKVLGKGCDSILVKALMNGKLVALKVRRVDSHVKTLINEGENQKLANSVSVGAKVYCFSEDFIAMELIRGQYLSTFIRKASSCDVRRVVIDLLEQCRRLDLIGLDHGELSRAHRHVIVTPSIKPIIIDFGSSSRNRRPANVSSIFSFLFLSKSEHSILLREKLRASFDDKEAIETLRAYKKSFSENCFMKVINLIASSEREINSPSNPQP